MAVIITGTLRNQFGYIVKDEFGKILSFYPMTQLGLAQAVKAARPANPARGKTYIPMSAGLPDGYGVLCVIDHDKNTVTFLAIVAGEILEFAHSSFDDAKEIAISSLPNPDQQPSPGK